MSSSKKILIVQRVITSYRLDLLKGLCDEYGEVGIITSRGDKQGTLKKANIEIDFNTKLKIYELNSIKIKYRGETRSTNLFFYPSSLKVLLKYDIVIMEGTTNIINNIYLIPIAKLFNKKVIWWDSGYSPKHRSFKRKIIDFFVKPLILMTNKQMAYSSKGEKYLRNYMGGKNAFTNLNTIRTDYFESIKDEVRKSILEYSFNGNSLKLLYVGVIEKRKKIEELIQYIIELNNKSQKEYRLDIVGGGNQYEELKIKYNSEQVQFHGPIYDKEKLKSYYFNSDLFILPGDGGLGILQSLLYGLPVLCLRGADGTEEDYIEEKSFLLESIDKIPIFLKQLKYIDRTLYLNYLDKVSSKKWINKLVKELSE